MADCIQGKHCEIVLNASEVIKRIRELCALRDTGMPAEPIVETIRNIVDCGRHKVSLEKPRIL